MNRITIVLTIITLATGCKKNEAKPDEAAKNVAVSAPSGTPTATAKPNAGEYALVAAAASGLAECDAIAERIPKYNACAALKDEDRVVMKLNVDQLPAITDAWKAEKNADSKDNLKGAAVAQCKDTASKLDAAIKAAGC